MITEFHIENFKSIEKLSIPLGKVNVFIGENGSGKSNILEAIAMASAATQNKLDNEFLAARGIRVTAPELMRSAFEAENMNKKIKLTYSIDKSRVINYELFNDNQPYSTWKTSVVVNRKEEELARIVNIFRSSDDLNETIESIKKLPRFQQYIHETNEVLLTKFIQSTNTFLLDFLIYSPENTSLRTFEKEGQIEPLGIYGEGLFKFLRYLANYEKEQLDEIKQYLKLFAWFKDFSIPERLFEGESYLQIKDKFLDDQVENFTQKSANEGFLFALFYFALFVTDKTPEFFAIDNIEASLNPKLCTKLVKSMAELAKKHDKQVILTTHSPAILDGLDLNDPEQKLFVVYRNKLGHTVINQVEKPQPLEGQEPIRLSEAFLRGYIGGLPKNFTL